MKQNNKRSNNQFLKGFYWMEAKSIFICDTRFREETHAKVLGTIEK